MSFHDREAISIENDNVRVTVLVEGGHIAEIFHKKQRISPLWIPPWPSGEPSKYNLETHPEFGHDAESKLLMGIMGHNLCLDMFGAPSKEEAEAGLTCHGESSVVRYDIQAFADELQMSASLPLSGLSFKRSLGLEGESVIISESVTNLTALDRPIGWTQHVTLGPPFLNAKTEFALPAAKSRTFESPDFDGGVMATATDFKWPNLPLASGKTVDLRTFGDDEPFSRYSAHLMEHGHLAGFAAFSPKHQTLFGYQWQRVDFPWLGLWQENKKRAHAPWNHKGVTCGLEFGVSPFPETRRQMIARPPLFGAPVYRWLPANSTADVTYKAFIRHATQLTEDAWS